MCGIPLPLMVTTVPGCVPDGIFAVTGVPSGSTMGTSVPSDA
jgi:hypothetical protein